MTETAPHPRLESLDPNRPEEARILLDFLRELKGSDPRYRDLVLRAACAPAGTALHPLANGLAGLYLAPEDPGRASDHLRTALAAVHGAGDRLEAAICVNLARCSLTLGRDYEALVASRRAVQNCRRREDALGLCHAHHHAAMAALEIRQWDECEGNLAAAEATLPALPPPLVAPLRRSCVAARADLALTRGDPAACLRLVAEADAIAPAPHPAWSPLFRAHALLVLCRTEEAATLLEEATAATGGRPPDPRQDFLRVLLAARRGNDPDAIDAWLDRLEAPGARAVAGSRRRGEMALGVGRVLGGREADRVRARRALDVAAAAFLERIGELDRFVTDLPAFAEPDADVRAMLERHRERLIREEHDVLEAAGRLFRAAHRAGDPVLRDLAGEDALVCVCAWCRRVRVRGRDWAPLAQLLPPGEAVTLTHGLCPACRRGIRIRQ